MAAGGLICRMRRQNGTASPSLMTQTILVPDPIVGGLMGIRSEVEMSGILDGIAESLPKKVQKVIDEIKRYFLEEE